ncbi:hypothetical protein HYH02_003401 [Chlamydomonas schloesseri]|uniref:Uncharacterized protein n=1 Tax=Chlamydomonas schloesseri TaxID=2026947 RepID=A0A835WS59_9CHLO|nr:hypothetical protein HYH02_003401 [Chlamydomonas schloesseri]|eukprot:KAG2451620.1 hypothetical protein HYH02_003401 [Chlamydomonas schloesseri]
MGCGASSEAGAHGAPAPKPAAAPPPRDERDPEWSLLVPQDDLKKVTAGASIPGYFLVVHDNKKHETPRLSVVCLAKGTCEEVRIKDKGRGLATAKDLECLWMVDAKVTGKKQAYYFAMTSVGDAWMFKISKRKKKWVAHGVHQFKVSAPPGANTAHTNCEGGRAYMEGGQLWLEYASRGGRRKGQPVAPWVVRHPLDIKAIRKGTFAINLASLKDVTYWPPTVGGNPDVRQCADLGQAVGMARFGLLHAAAFDDEVHETGFFSYILERLPGAQSGGIENLKPLFKLYGGKIEAIYDITKDISIIATDDEGRGAYLTVLHRHTGQSWKVPLTPPGGANPRLYGISGISPVDPAIKKKKDDSSSEEEEDSEQGDEEDEEVEGSHHSKASRMSASDVASAVGDAVENVTDALGGFFGGKKDD